MGASERANRDKAMAAFLKKSGYPHGRRRTVTHAPPVPDMQDVGSAAYRRRLAKAKEKESWQAGQR